MITPDMEHVESSGSSPQVVAGGSKVVGGSNLEWLQVVGGSNLEIGGLDEWAAF